VLYENYLKERERKKRERKKRERKKREKEEREKEEREKEEREKEEREKEEREKEEREKEERERKEREKEERERKERERKERERKEREMASLYNPSDTHPEKAIEDQPSFKPLPALLIPGAATEGLDEPGGTLSAKDRSLLSGDRLEETSGVQNQDLALTNDADLSSTDDEEDPWSYNKFIEEMKHLFFRWDLHENIHRACLEFLAMQKLFISMKNKELHECIKNAVVPEMYPLFKKHLRNFLREWERHKNYFGRIKTGPEDYEFSGFYEFTNTENYRDCIESALKAVRDHLVSEGTSFSEEKVLAHWGLIKLGTFEKFMQIVILLENAIPRSSEDFQKIRKYIKKYSSSSDHSHQDNRFQYIFSFWNEKTKCLKKNRIRNKLFSADLLEASDRMPGFKKGVASGFGANHQAYEFFCKLSKLGLTDDYLYMNWTIEDRPVLHNSIDGKSTDAGTGKRVLSFSSEPPLSDEGVFKAGPKDNVSLRKSRQ
jgi:hypothetical protein